MKLTFLLGGKSFLEFCRVVWVWCGEREEGLRGQLVLIGWGIELEWSVDGLGEGLGVWAQLQNIYFNSLKL